ncbi:hypothetical protein GLOIN_2v1781678 [Rhizophagus clarus]|uniref:Uncharacterized protein n=1 Tax=Rhizophagus clarus TaxID=94130 RepID=A0A8H3LE66_9GLOM|nr:hypothetical protein GLOIN_2v1781678 [Rhizophagus clarus]
MLSFKKVSTQGELHYLICFGDNLQYQVVSVQSPFDASVELHKIITPNKKTAVSGIHLFELQLKCIDRNRKSRPRECKPNEESSITTQIKRVKGLAKKEQIHFEDSIKDFYNFKDQDPSEEPDIIDPTIIEQVVNATGKEAY